MDEIANCNDMFDDSNNTTGTYSNQTAYEACLDGASDSYGACLDGVERADRYWAWIAFLARLRECLEEFPDEESEAQRACIQAALVEYQRALEDLINPPDDDCGDGLVVSAFGNEKLLGPMAALQASAVDMGNLDGKYPVFANTTLRFTAGVNATPGSSYSAADVPCLKSAALIAIYSTKTGVAVDLIDADTNVSDGTSFDIHVFSNKTVDATEIKLLSIFFDANNIPQLAELGRLSIQDSPLSGDWNRDEVLNTQDVVDFLSSYDAQTDRADLTNDGTVDSTDVEVFIENAP